MSAPGPDGCATRESLVRACGAECLARLLPRVADHLAGRPWQRPEPGPGGKVAALMREVPRR